MKEKPTNFRQSKNGPVLACLREVEQKKLSLQQCLEGRQLQRSLLVEQIEQAKLKDAQMLAAIDKDIADFQTQIQELQDAAAKFREQLHEHK